MRVARPTDNLGYLGEMAEWSIALPWKGSIRQRIGGSNPPLSAMKLLEIHDVWALK